MQPSNRSTAEDLPAQPICLALIDLTCGADFLELVKSGLLAALEAVPSAGLFGLITFSTKVRVMLLHCVGFSCGNSSIGLQNN